MHVVVELLNVCEQLVTVTGALLGRRGRPVLPGGRLAVGVEGVLRRHPEVLLDAVEAGPVEPLRHSIDLSVVDARIEGAESLGDGLDALVEGPSLREERASGLVVARLVGGDELVDGRHELSDLVLHERRVEVDGLLLLVGILTLDRDAVSGHRELRLADALADHPRLAQGLSLIHI